MSPQELEKLEKQVTLMEDIQAIENLQKMYGYYFDTAQYQAVIDLFSENTESVEITDHGVFRGKEGVNRMYAGMVGMKRPGWMFFEVMQSQGAEMHSGVASPEVIEELKALGYL